MANRRLPESARVPEQGRYPRLAACGVVAVDEVAKRVQRDVLRERHAERESLLRDRQAAAGLVEGEAEERAVDCVEREACRPPERATRHGLPEDGEVGVVAPEGAAVDRLEQAPDRRGHGTGDRWMKSTLSHNPEHARG